MEKQLRLFLWLKFLCRDGKVKLSPTVKKELSQLLEYKTIKSIDNHLNQLLKHRWITYNSVTDTYLLLSFNILRAKYYWEKRSAVITYPTYLGNIYAFVGAAIYTYLYKDFKRKEKEGESVSSKRDTFTNFPSSFPFDNYKPVATTGINCLFPGISTSKASRLKNSACKESLILVKKNYFDLNLTIADLDFAKSQAMNVVSKDGKLYLQQIDTILPLIQLRRRRK